MKTAPRSNTHSESNPARTFFSRNEEGSFFSGQRENSSSGGLQLSNIRTPTGDNPVRNQKEQGAGNTVIQKQEEASNNTPERSPLRGRLNALPPPPQTIRRPITDNAQRMEELLSFIQGREGAIPYFYCDHRGLVTIGIGHLVDSSSSSSAGPGLARALAATVQFRTASGTPATTPQVVAAWNAVKHAYNPSSPQNHGFYASVSNLRINTHDINTLLAERVGHYVQQFSSRRPIFETLDEQIQMALIDARFNPAGVSVFGSDVTELFNTLNYEHPEYNLERALQLFIDIWAGRGNAPYQNRHQQRINWFRNGIQHLQDEIDDSFENIINAIDPPDSELTPGYMEGSNVAPPGSVDL